MKITSSTSAPTSAIAATGSGRRKPPIQAKPARNSAVAVKNPAYCTPNTNAAISAMPAASLPLCCGGSIAAISRSAASGARFRPCTRPVAVNEVPISSRLTISYTHSAAIAPMMNLGQVSGPMRVADRLTGASICAAAQ